ncbi:MupA/Atu3671 family FMN-dependent luciferase-like monooxygenase [Sphaerisporangium rhizosphaerae]|uniref:MupA/Atu3671 family FMN-dependent luciferase-like monooxygenase n=1 Tax=Sphaerisporangium rhizosphaerae TaxID=2269375 RepID=A0ABW2PCJ1_9ACTN
MDLSLFYFSNDAQLPAEDRYRLVLEGARFGDARGFTAVWTPERHFHRFGGIYPNPAVTSAALASVTGRIDIRAGSVVAPLHHVSRIADDWAAVDALAGGRVGLSLASGWHKGDFVLRPDAYQDRQRATVEYADRLRRLWRQARPSRGDLPMWFSTGGSPGTLKAAAHAGVGVLTHLANQSAAELAARIAEYRAMYAACGHRGRGHVVLMLHTYLDEDLAAAEEQVRDPLERYLMSALGLFHGDTTSQGRPRGEARARLAVRPAYERYVRQGAGLFGSVDQAVSTVRGYQEMGVDEIACLIDFGVPVRHVLRGLEYLDELRLRVAGLTTSSARPANGYRGTGVLRTEEGH